MTRTAVAAIIAAVIATPVFAQPVVETPGGPAVVVAPVPGVVTRQTGATGDGYGANYSPTGRPEDAVTNNAAGGGNAGQPERMGSTGGSGGK